jgi:hypothetical protein
MPLMIDAGHRQGIAVEIPLKTFGATPIVSHQCIT